jgi:hypothetical protein
MGFSNYLNILNHFLCVRMDGADFLGLRKFVQVSRCLKGLMDIPGVRMAELV